MVSSLRADARTITRYRKLLQEVLEPLEETKGYLVVGVDSVYFEFCGIRFTDFGVIVLAVTHVHSIDGVRHDVDLLVLSQDDNPKIVRLDVKLIGSSRWIEDLGANYIYEKWGLEQEQFESYRKESLQIFLNLMQEQSERISELDDVNRFFKGLRCLLDTRDARIQRLQARNSSYAAEDSKSAIGFSKKGYIYLKNNVAFQCVVAYYRRFAKDFVLNESSLRRMLNNNGYFLYHMQTCK